MAEKGNQSEAGSILSLTDGKTTYDDKSFD